MIAVVDYGVGNLFSLVSSLKSIGADACVTSDAKTLEKADKIILPGVGAFGDAAEKLRKSGLDEVIIRQTERGKELMGICLGMQMLFEKSYEYGEHKGLGLLKGSIVPLEGSIPAGLKIPHIGWNALHFTGTGAKEGENQACSSGTSGAQSGGNGILRYINENDCVYFVHSYHAVGCEESLIATAEYGAEITAAVQKDNVSGCQFHPEKSGKVGLNILRAFCE